MTRSNALAVDLSATGADGGNSLPRRFGSYRLIDRLGGDPLGESWRAADAASGGRPLLLRLFHGEELDGESFWGAMKRRRQGSAAKSLPLAPRADLGLTDGIPWVAYDCLPGRSLAEMLHRSNERALPLQSEDAFFIAERVALALRAVHEMRCEGRRIAHGFLVPELIWISADGEVRLLGIEAAAGLAALPPSAAPRRAAASYLAPEVTAGGPPERADDLYSLGAVLQFLLAGEVPLPPSPDPGPSIEGATRHVEPSELRPEVDRLLREALAPRDERPSLEDWGRRLEKVTFDGGRSPSTFRLAFHMHSLFGSELEREEAPVAAPEAEPPVAVAPPQPPAHLEPEPEPLGPPPGAETLLLPDLTPPDEELPFGPVAEGAPPPALTVPAAAEALSPPALSMPEEATAVPEAAAASEDLPEPAADPLDTTTVAFPRPRTMSGRRPRSSRWPLVAAGSALVLAALLATGYLLRDQLGWAAPPAARPAAGPVVPAPEAPPTSPRTAVDEPVDESLASEDIERQVGELVEERSNSLDSTIEERYSSRIATLRQEVESARQAASRERPEPADSPAPASPPPAAATPVEERPQPAAASAAPASRPAGEPTVPTSGPSGSVAPAETPSPTAAAVSAPRKTPEAPAATPVAQASSNPAPPPIAVPVARPEEFRPPEPAAVRPGDLVEPGPGVVAPTLIRHPRPAYPPAAQRIGRAATVRLRLLVDENGEVVEVEPTGPQVGLGFDAAALRAARGTLWRPAEKDGVKVRMWVDLAIAFRPE